MKMRALAAVAVAAMIVAGPAFAAGTTMAPAAATTTTAAPTATAKPAAKRVHYYIVQAVDTKACSVVTKKPDGKIATMVGKYWYTSQAKANAAMKRAVACKGA